MERDQHELQFLGFPGVYRESSKIILKWRKIFAQITLALILPLCVVFLSHSLVSHLLTFRILDHEDDRDYALEGSQSYRDLSHALKKEWVAFWLTKLGYFIFVFIFSLLSTSAVVYTVACIYAAKQITFKKIMSVVPRVWKRLMVTFLWTFVTFVGFFVVAVALLIGWVAIVRAFLVGSGLAIAMLVILLILYVVVFVYLTMIWQLASVISVLEDVYGRKAMVKSRRLIKGKMGMSVGCFLGVLLWSALVEALFDFLVVLDLAQGIGIRIAVGLICLLLLQMMVLFDLVVQTVIYFVCKSYHHENIDKSSLSEHLEVYLGDYVPLKANSVQLEQLHV
ncbi:hypothetical protein ACJRO7_033864 [Eucalyptus globulus]|uniref:Polyadenylate-binding protein 1-B-binding protein n=1 Tax=Eucalyptus globulus TaxID=34317 RepID=A0ABD3J4T3_EUCGL